MSVDDPTLHELAARMACDAMGELSKAEFVANRIQQDYAFNEPSCEMAFGLADRGTEFLLQQGFGMSKNQCMYKTPVYGHGPWVGMYPANAVAAPTFYDKWTRARGSGGALCGGAAKAAVMATECCPEYAETCFI